MLLPLICLCHGQFRPMHPGLAWAARKKSTICMRGLKNHIVLQLVLVSEDVSEIGDSCGN